MPSITMTDCPDCGCGGGDYCISSVTCLEYETGCEYVPTGNSKTCWVNMDVSGMGLDSNWWFKGYQPGHETPSNIVYRFQSIAGKKCFATQEAVEAFLEAQGEYWDSFWYYEM